MINVTKTFFPPIDEYEKQLKRIWKNEWMTNRGELVLELENKIKKKLGLSNILITNNGTIPIQIALKILGGNGEIITTPFSYIATTSSIIWENCTPVFVDIDSEHLTIDETKIENAITQNTTCILATHVYGNPCNIEAIDKIAKKHQLHVIYDAAHGFAVEYNKQSIFKYGDVSTCSFHATKLFHTGEGGAIFCNDEQIMHQLFYSHNFGHDGPEKFHGLGINGKISELQAAMGLCVLPYIDEIIQKRKNVVTLYDEQLNFSNLKKLKIRSNTKWNYSYYPVIFNTEKSLKKVQEALNKKNIFPRRYFYPSLNTIAFTPNQTMKVSEDIAKRVLCLPLYDKLTNNEINIICNVINNQI